MTWTVGSGRYVLDESVRAGSSDEVRLGHLADDAAVRVLVTLTARHPAPQLTAIAVEEPVLYVGPVDPGVPYDDALVERLPAGVAASGVAPLAERDVIRIGAGLAAEVARQHARGRRLGGIYPELVFVTVETEAAFAGVCPYGPDFIASAPQPMHGTRSYRVPYLAGEVLLRGRPELASDVFATCATLFALGTGRHPFGDARDLRQLLLAIDTSEPGPWPGDPRLAAILAGGLRRHPAKRPTAAALRDALAAL